MKVIKLTAQHQPQYSRFVSDHDSGSFLQSWSWGDFQESQSRPAVRYGVFSGSDGQEMITAVQLLQTEVPHLRGFYLYAPYGPLLADDPASTARDGEEIIRALTETIRSDFPGAWFIRFEPKDVLPTGGKPTLHIQPGASLLTDITQDESALLQGMHPKTRYNIKVAAKHGVEVYSEPNHPLADEALQLLVQTSDRQGYKSYPKPYYQELLRYFQDQAQSPKRRPDCAAKLYLAVHDSKCVASAIMIDSGKTRTYLFGGSEQDSRNLMAPYALHWKAILDAKASGLKLYDWWGTETASGAAPGFVQFKLRWGGTQTKYAGASDIILNPNWYRAYTALRKINRMF